MNPLLVVCLVVPERKTAATEDIFAKSDVISIQQCRGLAQTANLLQIVSVCLSPGVTDHCKQYMTTLEMGENVFALALKKQPIVLVT